MRALRQGKSIYLFVKLVYSLGCLAHYENTNTCTITKKHQMRQF